MKLFWAIAIAAGLSNCTCADSIVIGGTGRDGGTDGGSDGGTALTDGGTPDGGSGQCLDGARCGDGGVCAGGTCCPSANVCGGACCSGSEVCSFNRCVAPGNVCREAGDCANAEFCDFSFAPVVDAGLKPADAGLCVDATGRTGRCLPRPPVCAADAGVDAGQGTSCVESCQFSPSSAPFTPVVKYSWGNIVSGDTASDVMMAPIVTQLDDDNCDGVVGATDRPDIVFTTFANGNYNALGTVHAISVKGGQLVESWNRPDVIRANAQLASGNIDSVPGNEIVGCSATGTVALNADGTTRWSNASACAIPIIGDVDGDGQVEVITEHAQLRGVDGTVKALHAQAVNNPTLADIDQNGSVDIVSGTLALNADGGVLADSALASSFTAVADLDLDGKPEIIGINSSTHVMHVWQFDLGSPNHAKVIRNDIDINGTLDATRCPSGSNGRTRGGGPPTAGDFNHDGYPDIALAGGVGYAVIDGKKLMNTAIPSTDLFLWTRETQDCSSAVTGSSLFDFDGDGRTEAVYADELQLHVYDSATGVDRFTTCNTSGTLIEYPLVADVDNDGQADLVVVANAYAFSCPGGAGVSGVRVFSSMSNDWVVTRRIWNQHAYSVTNIEEDGLVPKVAKANWREPGLNNFRQQKQPGQEFAAPDAVVDVEPACDGQGGLLIRVRNVGEAPLGSGVVVEVVKGTATVLGSVKTDRVLGPAQSETLVYRVTDSDVLAGATVFARISTGVLRECRTGNNASAAVSLSCIN